MSHQESPHARSSSSHTDALLTPTDNLVLTKEHRRIGCHLLLMTCTLVLVSAGAATLLLLWLTALRGVPQGPGESRFASALRTGAFLTSEGSKLNDDGTVNGKLLALTMTTITSQLVAVSSPFLVAMTAYCIVGAWLDEQQRPKAGVTNLPTPLQYGLLVKLSSTAGLMSMYDTLRYFFLGKKKRAAVPSLLVVAFSAVVTIYGVTHMIALTDLWLHLTSSSVLHNMTIPFVPNALETNQTRLDYALGVTFDESLCYPSDHICLAELNGFAAHFPYVAEIGMLIASNTSSSLDTAPSTLPSLSVITLNDEQDLAVIVPASINPSLRWTAPTFGIRSSCSSITEQCSQVTHIYHIINPMVYFNCSDAGFPYIPFDRWQSELHSGQQNINTTGRIGALLNTTVVQGDLATHYGNGGALPDNPQRVQIEMNWPLIFTVPFNESSAVIYLSRLGANAFLDCEMEFFNLTIGHEGDGKFGVVGEPERSTREFTAVMWEPLISQMVNLQLHANVQARAFSERNDDNFIASVNQELSRLSLAMFAGSTISAPASNFTITNSLLVGRYPVPPVLTYAFLLYLYALIVLGICFWASTIKTPLVRAPDGSQVPVLALAQQTLTDPLVLVGMAFPRSLKGVRGSVSTEPMESFGEGPDVIHREKLDTGNPDGGSDITTATGEQGLGINGKFIPRLRLGIIKEGEKAGTVYGLNETGNGT